MMIYHTLSPLNYELTFVFFAEVTGFVYIIAEWIYVIYLPISFRVASLTLGQSYDCPGASEVTLKVKSASIKTHDKL